MSNKMSNGMSNQTMSYEPTGQTVTFVEGHNQFGPNSLSHHAVFVGDNGELYIPKLGPVQAWQRLADVQKEVHRPVDFLNQAKRTGSSVSEQQMTDAYKPTTELQRVPQKVLKPDWNPKG